MSHIGVVRVQLLCSIAQVTRVNCLRCSDWEQHLELAAARVIPAAVADTVALVSMLVTGDYKLCDVCVDGNTIRDTDFMFSCHQPLAEVCMNCVQSPNPT